MLSVFDQLVEEKIIAAMQRGEFDDLPGTGAPLPEENNVLVPEEMRMACKIMKNAGMIPPEITSRCTIADIEQSLSVTNNDSERQKLIRKLHYLTMQLDESGQRCVNLLLQESYYHKILDHLSNT